jgi:hypothetical protein
VTAVGRAPRLAIAGRTAAPRGSELAGALAVAALAELLLVRVGSRTAIHIPALPALRKPYALMTEAGDVVLVLAQSLAIVTLAAAAAEGWLRGDWRGRAVMALTGAFAVAATAIRFGWGPPGLWQWATLATVASLAAASAGGRRTPALACFTAAGLLIGGHTAIQSLGVAPGEAGRWMLWLGEAAALAIPLAAAVAVRPRGRRRWFAAGAAGVAATAAMAGPSGWTLRFLTLWNLGLAGTFPPFAYGIAVATGAASFAAAPRSVWVPVALLAASGLGLHNTYQSALAVAALATLLLAQGRRGAAQ